MRSLWCGLAALLLFWAGCDALTFSPGAEIPVTEVDPTPGTLTLDLTASEDTLALWGTVEITYNLEALGTGPVDSLRFRLGDRVLPFTLSEPLVIQTTDFPDGDATLKLAAYASSGTGSLADVYGEERIAAEIMRPVVIDNAPPETVAVQSLAPENGRLTLRWERYPRVNFSGYRIYRSAPDGSNRRLLATISDRDSTAWGDPTYIGGDAARYDIELVAGDGRAAQGSSLTSRSYPVPEIVSASGDASREIFLSWTGTRFPGALDQYEIYEPGPINGNPLFATPDTVASFPLSDTFGAVYSFRLVTRGREATNGTVGDTAQTEEFEVALDSLSGFSKSIADTVFPVPSRNAIFGVDAATRQLVLRDVETLIVLAEASLPGDAVLLETVASLNGRLSVMYGRGSQLYAALLDPATLAIEREVAIDPLLGSASRTGFDTDDTPQLTDDGVLFFRVLPRLLVNYTGPVVVGVDLTTGTRVAAFEDAGRGVEPLAAKAVSPDGRFLVLNDAEFGPYYERDSEAPEGYSALETQGRHEGDLRAAAFVSPTEVAVVGMSSQNEFMPEEVVVLDLEAGLIMNATSVLRAVAPELTYDPVSERLAYTSDLNDGTFASVLQFFSPEGNAPVSPANIVPSTFDSRHAFAAGVLWNGGRFRRLFE
ncbi:MAG: hypothetical protein Rubg2KO_25640 [Rubricoccaceae bacterium]